MQLFVDRDTGYYVFVSESGVIRLCYVIKAVRREAAALQRLHAAGKLRGLVYSQYAVPKNGTDAEVALVLLDCRRIRHDCKVLLKHVRNCEDTFQILPCDDHVRDLCSCLVKPRSALAAVASRTPVASAPLSAPLSGPHMSALVPTVSAPTPSRAQLLSAVPSASLKTVLEPPPSHSSLSGGKVFAARLESENVNDSYAYLILSAILFGAIVAALLFASGKQR